MNLKLEINSMFLLENSYRLKKDKKKEKGGLERRRRGVRRSNRSLDICSRCH